MMKTTSSIPSSWNNQVTGSAAMMDRQESNTSHINQQRSQLVVVKPRPMTNNGKLQGALAGTGSGLQEALYGLASGVIFGLVSPVVGHPFDTVKTRMQADAAYQSTTLRQTVYNIYRSEGIIKGFYRGFIPPLLGSVAYRGVLFSAYAGAYAASEKIEVLQQPIPGTYGILRPSVLIGAFSAAFARAAIESPLDFVKVRYMLGQNVTASPATSLKATTANTLSTMTSNNLMNQFAASPMKYVSSLYRGFVPTVYRTVGLLGAFFVMVDNSVRLIPDVVNAPGYGPFFKGGICATAAWAFAFPFETAKSIVQADTRPNSTNGTWKVLKQLYLERGIVRGWYRGFGPGASRSFVANGISMTVYAWFQDQIRSEQN